MSFVIVLLAGGVAGLATIALLPQITAIPRERWSLVAMRPLFVQSAMGALLPGFLASSLRAPPPAVLSFALIGATFPIARLVVRYAPIRAVKRLTAALNDDARRPTAMAAIGPALDRAKPSMQDTEALGSWAQAGLIGAAYLIDADEPIAARAILERMRGLTFRGASQANHALLWAHVEIFAHDLVAARSALGSIQPPVTLTLLQAHRDVLEALALACEGHHVLALARVDGWKHAENWYSKLRLTVKLVAHSGDGDDAAVSRDEAEMSRRFGPRALKAARALADGSDAAASR